MESIVIEDLSRIYREIHSFFFLPQHEIQEDKTIALIQEIALFITNHNSFKRGGNGFCWTFQSNF